MRRIPAGGDCLSLGYEDVAQVAVAGHVAAFVGDLHDVALALERTDHGGDAPLGRAEHGITLGGDDVQAVVPGGHLVEGVHPLSDGSADLHVGDAGKGQRKRRQRLSVFRGDFLHRRLHPVGGGEQRVSLQGRVFQNVAIRDRIAPGEEFRGGDGIQAGRGSIEDILVDPRVPELEVADHVGQERLPLLHPGIQFLVQLVLLVEALLRIGADKRGEDGVIERRQQDGQQGVLDHPDKDAPEGAVRLLEPSDPLFERTPAHRLTVSLRGSPNAAPRETPPRVSAPSRHTPSCSWKGHRNWPG